jgi:hypothetical protein
LRDSKGRFTSGHACIAKRDSVSGRFISNSEFEYRKASSEVDYFLDCRRAM